MGNMRSKDEKKERAGVRERVCKALDIVPDTLPGSGTVEIRGRHSVSISEGGKILAYTPERVSVAAFGGQVSVLGKRLVCTSYCRGSVRIDGYVCSVVFEEV